MKITAEPRSDQWNADDFIGGSRTFTIAGVKVGSAEQKYDIELVEGEGRAWRPPLTMLRLLIAAWGDDSQVWVGRRVTLYRDASVRFGSDEVGGIRVSHMSHLPGGKKLTVRLTSTRGRRAKVEVEPLPDTPPAPAAGGKGPTPAGLAKAFGDLGVTLDQLEARQGVKQSAWTADDLAQLAALGKSIKDGKTTVAEAFPTAAAEPAGPPTADALNAALVAQLGDDLTAHQDFMSAAVGHPVDAVGELTPDELAKVLADLTEGESK